MTTLSKPLAFLKQHFLYYLPVVSFVSALLGIGGALLLFPLLIRFGYSSQQAATYASLSVCISASIACCAIIIHPAHLSGNPYFLGDVFWPFVLLNFCIASRFVNQGIQLNSQYAEYRLHQLLALLLVLLGSAHTLPHLFT